jgi:hypothetical protein
MIDKELLFTRRLEEEDVEIPDVGTVRVRALTRDEGLRVSDKEMPRHRLERVLLAAAMIDPILTEDEVGKWQRNSGAGEIKKVVDVIQRLSGLVEDAAKSDVPEDGDES